MNLSGNRIWLTIVTMLVLCVSMVACYLSSPLPVQAQVRSYSYDRIALDIAIREDTTFDVRETQTYRFVGRYNQGWRSIPYKKIDSITDITVTDRTTGVTLRHSASRLNKTDPASWGAYTYFEDNGAMNIEWYYDLADTTHTWVLEYTVHGGLAFYGDHDELYWNILTDYTVPVAEVHVRAILPQAATVSALQAVDYLEGGVMHVARVIDGRSFEAQAQQLAPQAKYTVAFGWPKGIVDQSAYWHDFVQSYLLYFISAFILICAGVFAAVYWYYTERYNSGRGLVVPEYEPPSGLPPAMGELIVRERTSVRTWPATIVHLATRGILTIEEDPDKTLWQKAERFLSHGMVKSLVLIGFTMVFMGIAVGQGNTIMLLFFFMLFTLFALQLVWQLVRGGTANADYIIRLTTPDVFERPETFGLHQYEMDLLAGLFSVRHLVRTLQTRAGAQMTTDLSARLAESLLYNNQVPSEHEFRTRDLRKKPTKAQRTHSALTLARKTLLEEVSVLGVYVHSLVRESKWPGWIIFFVGIVMVVSLFDGFPTGGAALLVSSVTSVSLILYMIYFEARLNPKGNELREAWLGFRMYLETAERYRVQNLRPEQFEEFLPYAMMFGIEKKWAKAFEHLSSGPVAPSWYHSSSGAFSSHGVGFSPSSFAGSFSASFGSAIATSAGGGASGGGGGAGGGGGGGGGGAS